MGEPLTIRASADAMLAAVEQSLRRSEDPQRVATDIVTELIKYPALQARAKHWPRFTDAHETHEEAIAEVAWAIEKHQALRFFPDLEVGYEYPTRYIEYFGEDYVPEPYLKKEHDRAKKHKFYMSSREIMMHDVYAFDPYLQVDVEIFTDIIGRNFKQPKEGLGFDGSPTAHMWRSIIWPNNFL